MAELSKSLGVMRGTALMLNIVLGAGLLTLPGLAVEEVGPAAILVWIVCAVAAAPLLWIFAILGRQYPDAGGVAAIMGHAFGKWGRTSATLLFLGAVSVGLPAIALTGGHYAAAAIGGQAHLYAIGLILAALAVNFLSAEKAGKINAFVASLVLAFILVIAGVSWAVVSPDLGAVVAAGQTDLPDIPHFVFVFMMIFFAFTGWEVSANLGGEFRDPNRDLPRAMALSFVVAVMLYLILAVVVAGAGEAGSGPAPFARIFGDAFGAPGSSIVSGAAVFLIFANLSAAIWAVSRMVYSAARDDLLPSVFGRIKGDIPLNAVMLTALTLIVVVWLVAMGLFNLGQLLAAAGQNFLLLYAGAAASLIPLTTKGAYRVLAFFCLALLAALLIGRGIDGIIYPAALIAVSLLIVTFQKERKRSVPVGDG